MQFLTISRRRIDVFSMEAFTPELLAGERAQIHELNNAGKLCHIWVRDDLPGAVIIWEASTEDELRASIGTLPLFQAGMLEILTLIPLKAYPGMGPSK
jgi:muconolactone delta-isomerase